MPVNSRHTLIVTHGKEQTLSLNIDGNLSSYCHFGAARFANHVEPKSLGAISLSDMTFMNNGELLCRKSIRIAVTMG